MRRTSVFNYLTACVLLFALILGAACSPQKDSGNRAAAAAAVTEVTEAEPAVTEPETEAPVTLVPETEPAETNAPTAAPETEAPPETEASLETEAPSETEAAPETEAAASEPVLILPSEDREETAETVGGRQQPPEETEVQVTYVLNKNTKKFHEPSCSSVGDIKPENRWDFTGTREEVIDMGYVPCKRCDP